MQVMCFDKFWEIYPRKVGKGAARRKWQTKKCDNYFDEIIKAVEQYTNSQQWESIRYIPHPATFLNQERWEDEIPGRENTISDFRMDANYVSYIGYCSKCKQSDFYSKYDILGESRCCKKKLQPCKENC